MTTSLMLTTIPILAPGPLLCCRISHRTILSLSFPCIVFSVAYYPGRCCFDTPLPLRSFTKVLTSLADLRHFVVPLPLSHLITAHSPTHRHICASIASRQARCRQRPRASLEQVRADLHSPSHSTLHASCATVMFLRILLSRA